MFQRRRLLFLTLSLLAALLVFPNVQAGLPKDSVAKGQQPSVKPTRPQREGSHARRTPLWRLRPSLPAPRIVEDPNAPTVDVAHEAALTARGSGDLDPTIDVQITQEIIDKAAELGSVQAMYEFVRNECAFQPYYGSQKGSVETLRQRAGNDYDLASLLIALLRASGTPARYAVGMVEMPVARVNSWLAVEHGQVAGSILFTHGMEGVSVVSGPNVVAVRCRRVWVEAQVPRGFGSATWVPLDPAFHLTSVTSGLDIPEEMNLNGTDFIDEYYNPSDLGVTLPRAQTPLEVLKDQIGDYLDANHPGMTLSDAKRTHEIVAEELGILPSSLPYTVRSRDLVFSEIPANRRYRIRFEMLDAGLNTLINYTVDLPTMAGKRVTIDYVGATQADQNIIDANGGIYQTPPSSVDLKPVLRIDGQQVAVGTAGVGMGLYHYSDMYFLAPVNGQGLPQNVVPAIFNVNICGASQAIAIGIEGSADRLLIPPPADDAEGTLSMNYDTGVDYLANVRNDELELAELMHAFVTTDVTTAILHNVVKVTYNGFGDPQTFDWAGLLVDADRAIAGYWPVDRLDPPGAEPKDFLVIAGANGSAWENFIFERNFTQDSVSTMKILQHAIDAGVTVYQHWDTLPLPANTQPTAVRNALTNAINNGHEVTFPADPMTIGTVGTGQWTGTGWIDMDPFDGAAGYIISGNNNGGSTVEIWPPEFIDLQEGDRSVVNVVIEITQPVADSPEPQAVFTRDSKQKLEFKYNLHVTYSDSSTAVLGPYTKTTQNTTKTFTPGNYTFHVWVARFAWFSFGIWDAERKVSIVGVLIREKCQAPNLDGCTEIQGHQIKDPPKVVPVRPPTPETPYKVPVIALVFPEKDPNGNVLASGYAWSADNKLTLETPAAQITNLLAAGQTPSGDKDDQKVEVEVTLPGGKKQLGYAKFIFTQEPPDEKHKMTVAKIDLDTDLNMDGNINNDDEPLEPTPGAYVVVNNDDDDRDGTVDTGDGQVVAAGGTAGSRDEDNTKRFQITNIEPAALQSEGTVILSRSNGKPRLFSDPKKGTAAADDKAVLFSATAAGFATTTESNGRKMWKLSEAAQRTEFQNLVTSGIWVEGLEASGAARDTHVKVSYIPKDKKEADVVELDRIETTVVGFEQIRAEIDATPPHTVRANAPANHTFDNAAGGIVYHLDENTTDRDRNFDIPRALVMIRDADDVVPLTVTRTPAVDVRWAALRSADDAAALGAGIPALTATASNTVVNMAVNERGSFLVSCYVDANGSTTFDSGEPRIILPLILVDATLNADATAPHSANITVRRVGTATTWDDALAAGGGAIVVNTGTFAIATPADAAIYLAGTVDFVGGGANGRRGLDRAFGGWVNNVTQPLDLTGTYAGGHSTERPFADNAVAHAAPIGRSFFPGDPAPNIIATPLLDSGRPAAGTGGNTATLGQSRHGTTSDLALGRRVLVEAVDSPGFPYFGDHPGHDGNRLTSLQFNIDFGAWLSVWTNGNGAAGATGFPTERTYSVVTEFTWTLRGEWNVAANGTTTVVTAGAVAKGAVTTHTPPARASAQTVEVRPPSALPLVALDARN